ncbi:MAG: oxidoreductase [Gammaproteobacteria bacterium]|nr:MAG: oxidoreductase [Gammaproteobacteria bacterium]
MISTSEKLFLRVSRIRELSSNVRAIQLRSKNDTELPLVSAGARLAIPFQGGSANELRDFYLCSDPTQREFYEIAVPSENAPALTDGAEIECEPPTNSFLLHADASPAVLIAEGIGIAPLLTIANTLALRGRRFQLHYAGLNKSEMAFADELQTKYPRHTYFYYTDQAQHINVMDLLANAPGNSLFYACGSQTLLENIENCARTIGIPKDRIQQEPSSTERLEKDKALIIELAHSNKLIQVKADQPILAALLEAGVQVKFDCCVGDCGTCAVKILQGEAEHRDHVLTDVQKAQGFICICVSRSKTEMLTLAL